MACHEIASLRLGLMQILGIHDEAERQHEIAEVGDALEKPGPLRSLANARDLDSLNKMYATAVTALGERAASMTPGDPQIAYVRSLLILTKKVELDLRTHAESLDRFYRDLEEMHDFVHEIYPVD